MQSRDETLLLEDSSPELTPDWSPDGRLSRSRPRDPGAWLWTVAARGGAPIQLTTNSLCDLWPRWSPDGRWILFFSRRDTNGERDELCLRVVLNWFEEVERLVPQITEASPGSTWNGREENQRALSMIGQTLAHDKILETIGSGGWVSVYRATDAKLNPREVAIPSQRTIRAW